MEETAADFLTDFIEQPQVIQAGTGKRLANFLIDYIIFLLLMVCIGIVWALISPGSVYIINAQDAGFKIMERIISLLIYGFYMSAIEAITGGRSLGKLITGTKAVNEDGSNITAATAFKRGFSRAVPFEVFSAFGSPAYPWHDKWTHTYVIDLKQTFV